MQDGRGEGGFSDCSKNRGFPAECGLLAAGKWQILKEKDSVAERGEFELSLYFSDHYFFEIASAFCRDI